MKTFKITAMAVLAVFMITGLAFAQAYKPYVRTIELNVLNVPTFESGLGLTTPGDEWYVDSNATGTDAGTSWTDASLTIDAAINLAAASNGDIIHVSPTHTETYIAADGFDLDKAGITIIFEGDAENRAILIFGHADATVACGAANNTIYGGRYAAGITAVTAGIMVEAGCDNFTMVGPVAPEPTTAGWEFVDFIDLAALADSVHIYNLVYSNADAIGADHVIDMGNGVNKDFRLINAYIYGEFAISAVWSNDADEEVLIAGGNYTNLTNGEHVIEFSGSALGTIQDVVVRTDAQGTAVDPGGMSMVNVCWDDDAVEDSVCVPVVAGGESTQALADVHLDHMMALDGTTSKFPEQAVADSTICKMLGDDDPALCTTYDNSTDSLEAIGNLVASAAQVTDNDTSLATIHLNHLMALDGATEIYPEQAVSDSTICKMLGDDDPAVCTTYDNSTDSLEALGVKTTAIDTETTGMQTLDGATQKYPENAVDDSILCKILADDDPAVCSTYDNATDSLEAISVALAAGTGVTTATAAIFLDNIMALDGATQIYPENAVEDSTICKMLADDDPANCSTYDNTTDSLEAIGVKTTLTQSRLQFITVSNVQSDAIPNNTQTAGEITGAASGDLWLEEVAFQCDAVGWAVGTNIELSVDNVYGPNTADLPIYLEVMGSFGATNWVGLADATSHSFPLLLESGKIVYIHADDNAPTGTGKCTVAFKWTPVAAGATIAPADLP
ncbi:hypothetical protein LCGC14_0991010 [marine sediment metagenome]|uniref:Uncharacterized protein n=1 Tax=marine sediment metagenome TaxID=412755 RepID=A0A0F9NSD0_9ZZZZ